MKYLICLLLILSNINALAHEGITIRDIPWKFDGISGDLFKERKVTLKISELLDTEVITGEFGTRTNNEVKGSILIEGRDRIDITRFDLESNNHVKNVYSVYVKIKNRFEKTLFLTLKYDLISNTFKLNEIPSRRHATRFFLQGKK